MRWPWQRRPQPSAEERVGYWLLNLPRCTRRVKIIAPEHQHPSFRCECTVLARELEDRLHQRDWRSRRPDPVAWKALELWLQGANGRDGSVSVMPDPFARLLRPSLKELTLKTESVVFCPECAETIPVWQHESFCRHHSPGSPWSEWTERWQCPQGHLLFEEEYEIELFFGSGGRRKAEPEA